MIMIANHILHLVQLQLLQYQILQPIHVLIEKLNVLILQLKKNVKNILLQKNVNGRIVRVLVL